MKIYNGWVLLISGQEYMVDGSIKIRGKQTYLLKGRISNSRIRRENLLAAMASGEITYVGNTFTA